MCGSVRSSAGRLEVLASDADGLAVRIGDVQRRFTWRWLRDHARDDASYHPTAHQRLVPMAVVATTVPGRATADQEGTALVVEWPNGPTSSYHAHWLAAVPAGADALDVGAEPAPWTASSLGERLVTFDGGTFVGGAAGDGVGRVLDAALQALARDGLFVIHGLPTTTAATRGVLERFGYLRRTIFGELWEFSSDGALDDTASTSMEITPHTDGTYSHDAPGLLGLHCHRYEATGGENVLVDGLSLAAGIEAEAADVYGVLCSVDVPGRYLGDGVHLMASRPVFRRRAGRVVQVSWNHHDRAPFVLPEPEMSDLYDALSVFDEFVRRPAHQLEVALRPGDMVVFDNWRLLHGRRAFHGERRIAGGYVNREDVESTMRLRRACT